MIFFNLLSDEAKKALAVIFPETVPPAVDVTLADVATVDVASNAILGDSNDYVQLTFVNGKWMETGRSITV